MVIQEVNRLELNNDGSIKATVKNLSVLSSIRAKINRIIITPEYRAEVKEFAGAFNEIYKLQNLYWKQQEATFKPRTLLKEIRKQSIKDVVRGLTETGLSANVGDKITEILKTNITSGGSYKQLASQLKESLLSTETDGVLQKYAKTFTTTAINDFNAQYTQVVSSDLGYEWFVYDNTDIDTTRPFCDAMTDQPYFHISEVPDILKAKGLYYTDKKKGKTKVPINPTTKLPYGLKAGTNPANFFVNRGGWNCGHQIRPLIERLVPTEVQARVYASAAYKKWAAINKPPKKN